MVCRWLLFSTLQVMTRTLAPVPHSNGQTPSTPLESTAILCQLCTVPLLPFTGLLLPLPGLKLKHDQILWLFREHHAWSDAGLPRITFICESLFILRCLLRLLVGAWDAPPLEWMWSVFLLVGGVCFCRWHCRWTPQPHTAPDGDATDNDLYQVLWDTWRGKFQPSRTQTIRSFCPYLVPFQSTPPAASVPPSVLPIPPQLLVPSRPDPSPPCLWCRINLIIGILTNPTWSMATVPTSALWPIFMCISTLIYFYSSIGIC